MMPPGCTRVPPGTSVLNKSRTTARGRQGGVLPQPVPGGPPNFCHEPWTGVRPDLQREVWVPSDGSPRPFLSTRLGRVDRGYLPPVGILRRLQLIAAIVPVFSVGIRELRRQVLILELDCGPHQRHLLGIV